MWCWRRCCGGSRAAKAIGSVFRREQRRWIMASRKLRAQDAANVVDNGPSHRIAADLPAMSPSVATITMSDDALRLSKLLCSTDSRVPATATPAQPHRVSRLNRSTDQPPKHRSALNQHGNPASRKELLLLPPGQRVSSTSHRSAWSPCSSTSPPAHVLGRQSQLRPPLGRTR